eukprot:TRINITY_DN1357_c2_g1_i1.p1 TRINITY_DN1357_c2_g1~~TRINITY_DN1357_c2_g1_i1.p1  ORF type:complete len:222 (+),score=28.27 TRINITY_DN1357_c2_g1_i1:130-795(+)
MDEGVRQSLNAIQALYNEWQMAGDTQKRTLAPRLTQEISDAQWEIDDLQKAFDSQRVVSPSRREENHQEILQFRRILKNIEDGMSQGYANKSAASFTNSSRMNNNSSPSSGFSEGGGRSGMHEQQQQQMMAEQDTALDRLAETVGNIGYMSREIGVELEDQNQLLDEFDYEVDDTHSRLSNANKYVDRIIDGVSTNKSWCVIIVLALILVGVIILSVAIPA